MIFIKISNCKDKNVFLNSQKHVKVPTSFKALKYFFVYYDFSPSFGEKLSSENCAILNVLKVFPIFCVVHIFYLKLIYIKKLEIF